MLLKIEYFLVELGEHLDTEAKRFFTKIVDCLKILDLNKYPDIFFDVSINNINNYLKINLSFEFQSFS